MRKIVFFCGLTQLCFPSTAQIHLVKDITQGIVSDSNPRDFISYKDQLFFTIDNPTGGTEFWKTDGTEAGTIKLKNGGTGVWKVHNDILFFASDDGLWSTDGTTSGTYLIKDVTPITKLFSTGNLLLMYQLKSTLTMSEQFSLWKSDGTALGTTLIRDNLYTSYPSTNFEVMEYSGYLYFPASLKSGALSSNSFDTSDDVELWKSDGTSIGTYLFKDILPGTHSVGIGTFNHQEQNQSSPRNMTVFNGKLFFIAWSKYEIDSGYSPSLWQTDGTLDGTIISSEPCSNITIYNGNMLLSKPGGLWLSDGTLTGTSLFVEGAISKIENLNRISDQNIYFSDQGLWKVDVNTFWYNYNYDITNCWGLALALDRKKGYFFAGNIPNLWVTQGTSCTTRMVNNLSDHLVSRLPQVHPVLIKDKLFFSAWTNTNGVELFYYDTNEDPNLLGCKLDQAIKFDLLKPKTIGDSPFELGAISSSDLPIIYSSSNEAVATVSGNTVTIVGTGATLITANQPGNELYDAAGTVTRELAVQGVTGVTEEIDYYFKIFPNPSRSNISVDFRNELNSQIFLLKIFDSTGRLIVVTSVNGGELRELEIANLTAGSYVLKIENNVVSATRIFIKD
jgi:ELWxxDGT repeat protein